MRLLSFTKFIYKGERMKILKGIALARVSTAKQNIESGGNDQQMNIINNTLAEISKKDGNKYEVKEKYEEIISGNKKKTKKRIHLREIARKAEAGQIDFIIVKRLDRFSRDLEFLTSFYNNLLESKKVRFISVDHGEFAARTLEDWVKFIQISVQAETVSREQTHKTIMAQASARIFDNKDTSTKPVLGLDPHPELACFYVINPNEQKIVEDIYRKFVDTQSLQATAKYCNERGYKTKKVMTQRRVEKGVWKNPKPLGGNPFDSANLKRLLLSPKIRGEGKFEDVTGKFGLHVNKEDGLLHHKYDHQPVVPLELCEEVERILLRDSGGKFNKDHNDRYLLSGLVYDDSGFLLSGQSPTGESGDTFPSYSSKRNNKNGITIGCDLVEKIVLKRLDEFIRTSQTIKEVIEQNLKDGSLGLSALDNKIKECRARVKETEDKVQKFSEFLTETILQKQKDEDFVAVSKRINSNLEKSESDLTKYREELENWIIQKENVLQQFNDSTLPEFLEKAVRAIRAKPVNEKKLIIRRIFSKIILDLKKNQIELHIRLDPKGMHDECSYGAKGVRIEKRWLGWRDSNSRPTD